MLRVHLFGLPAKVDRPQRLPPPVRAIRLLGLLPRIARGGELGGDALVDQVGVGHGLWWVLLHRHNVPTDQLDIGRRVRW